MKESHFSERKKMKEHTKSASQPAGKIFRTYLGNEKMLGVLEAADAILRKKHAGIYRTNREGKMRNAFLLRCKVVQVQRHRFNRLDIYIPGTCILHQIGGPSINSKKI